MAEKEIVNRKQRALKKLKFYDSNFKVFGISLLLFIYGIFFIFPSFETIIFILAFSLAISLGIINWGMLYHQFKSKSYGWLISTILLFFIGGAPISLMLFYWVKMRKEFKKGNGVYS